MWKTIWTAAALCWKAHTLTGALAAGNPPVSTKPEGSNENGEERTIKTLFCDNAGCETRKLKQFVHFVGKKAMNIEGLSEATLEK